MKPASTRHRHLALAFAATLAAYALSPLLPLVAAEDGGLGSGGAAFAFNYTLVLGIILSFVFGFGLRDYIQKRMLRAQAAKRTAPKPAAKPAPAPPRP